MALAKFLVLLGGCVEKFTSQLDVYILQVWWHLESDRQFFIIFERQIAESFRYWQVVDVILSGQDDLDVLKQVEVGTASINI